VATALACLACCVVELGLLGGLSAATFGVELSEWARFTPALVLAVLATAVVVGLRRRRRRARRSGPGPVGPPRARPDLDQ
jgi:hypothetical protein